MNTLTDAPIEFDPWDYAFQEDPYPLYARLRAEDPLHHNERDDFWVLSRHADVARAFRSESVYSSAMGVSLDASAWGPRAHQTMSILALDPPQQTRMRSLVSKGFTPRRVRELEPRIQELTDRYFDRVLRGARRTTSSRPFSRSRSTTTKLLGNALAHLTRHPDQLAAVLADADLGGWCFSRGAPGRGRRA